MEWGGGGGEPFRLASIALAKHEAEMEVGADVSVRSSLSTSSPSSSSAACLLWVFVCRGSTRQKYPAFPWLTPVSCEAGLVALHALALRALPSKPLLQANEQPINRVETDSESGSDTGPEYFGGLNTLTQPGPGSSGLGEELRNQSESSAMGCVAN